ncbi:MAG: UDP-2,4-diacetamido-2,4,6-trideoxy-beta-L-altropyranose hydrolase [Gammaproteobacteria bacterium]|nr:UDP-2,4-diacetamido-2,4,6-trideoxy-beta-L-altropyranose hydrolase [Gammaproteobacteria bacterium]
MLVAFRVDASQSIGTGHLSRCLVLARALHLRLQARCLFVCRRTDGFPIGRFKGPDDFEILWLEKSSAMSEATEGRLKHSAWLGASDESDADETVSLLRSQNIEKLDWIVADHYGIDAVWERKVSPMTRYQFAIDDLADREHAVDLLLDQNLKEPSFDAYEQLAPGAKILLGPRFALLREGFSEIPGKPRVVNNSRTSRLLLCFGGSDEANWTESALSALLCPELSRFPIDVIVPEGHRAINSLTARCRNADNVTLHVSPPDIAVLMKAADIAIGAGGVMVWERCALGLPTLAWPIADNQVELLNAAAQAGVLQLCDSERIGEPSYLSSLVLALHGDTLRRRAMSGAARSTCDGKGAERVVSEMARTGT